MTNRSAPSPPSPRGRAVVPLTLLLGAALGCAANRCPPAAAPTAPAMATAAVAAAAPAARVVPPPGPLGEVAGEFLARYRVERNRQRAALTPVVVVSGDNLTLYRDGGSEKATVVPAVYHLLKAAAHLPFATYLQLLPAAESGDPVDAAGIDELLASAAKVARAPASPELTPQQAARQAEIVARSQTLLAAAKGSGRVSLEGLRAFTRGLEPLLRQSADEAGCLQVEAYHQQMQRWRAQLSREEWARLSVVVRARHQSRHRSVASQYFGWLLPATAAPWAYPGESDRVIYAEYMSPGDEPLDLLAAVTLDARAGEDFAGDSSWLGQDVLADGAARCIAALGPPPGAAPTR